MENTLLVGLSRQMTLERQMDVVANNVANINTTGFKADRSLFEEYLSSPAHEDNFVRADRRVSFVQDRATFHDFAPGPPSRPRTRSTSRSTATRFLVVQTPAGERYTRDGGLQINNQGQLVTASGDPVLGTSGPIVFQPTDKRNQHRRRRQRHRGRRHRPRRLGPRQAAAGVSFADAQKLVKEGSNLYSRRPGAPPSPTPPRRCARASSRSRTSIRSTR